MSWCWSVDPEIKSWLPQLQAHRGYWVGGLQQNSLASIQAAHAMGYAMAEFDVRMTSDGALILFHDDYYAKRLIRKTTLQGLKVQISITTLEELFQWFQSTRDFKLNLEIKSKILIGSPMETKIHALIKKYALEKRILISSFNPLSLFRMRKLDAGIFRALLLTYKREEGNNWFVTSMMMNIFCQPHVLHLRYDDYSKAFDKIATKVPIVLWTVNDLKFYQNCREGIHGIISDEITPELFKTKS